jgi:Zn-dependent peptidase ImmA (M78 family)
MINKVKIGSKTYSVIEKEIVLLDNEAQFGLIDYQNNVIEIKKDQQKDTKLQTLCHELIHAISQEYSCSLSHDDVDRLGNGIAQIITDNKEVFKL